MTWGFRGHMSRRKHRKPQGRKPANTKMDAESKASTDEATDGVDIRRGILSDLQGADTTDDTPVDKTPGADDAPGKPDLSRKAISKFLVDAYEVLAETFGISLMVAMVVARRGGGPTIQWVFGITAMLAVILSKTVFANDISDIYSEAKEQADESRRRDEEELAEGNFDGVPVLFQKFLKYPTQEDYDQIKAEAERQRELLRSYRKPGKSDKGNSDNQE